MIGQRALLAIAIVCGAVAGGVYYASLQRISVVVAAHPLDADRPIGPDDVATKDLPPDALPPDAVRATSDAIGRVPRAPQWSGQILVAPALGTSAAAFHSGLVPPAGQRAVAIPVAPAQAIGGALVAGAHVDVIAVPVTGRAPANRITEIVAANVTVLDVRGESGAPFSAVSTTKGAVVSSDRLGSVVVAIAPADELRVADRVATSTFVLVFVPVRE